MWNLSIQREVGWNTVVEAAYAANVGHKLLGAGSMQINQVPPALMGPGNAQARRPYPQFGNITVVRRMWTNSSYHSMNLRVEKRFSSGLNFLANYTWSKFIDDVPAGNEVGGVNIGMQNYYDRHAEKSLAGNDARHRFVASALYELPAGKGRRWLTQGLASTVLGGWNLGTILTLQAGSPLALVTQTNTTSAFTPGPQKVNLLRDPTLPESQRTIRRWFDTGAAMAPAPYTFGTAGRAALIGPGLANVNLSVLKNHRWRERFNIQFRFEAFNAFNRVNFGEPGGALGSPTFGVISSSAAARILQLGMRFEF